MFPYQAPAGMREPLFGVSCPGSHDCWAVGYESPTNDAYTDALVLHFDGRTWGAVDVPQLTSRNVLRAVGCLSAADCWAVGTSTQPDGDPLPLALHFDGTAWSSVPVPSPVVGFVAGEPSLDILTAVGCATTSECFATGVRAIPGSPSVVTFVDQWDGSRWKAVGVPGLPATPYPAPATAATFPGLGVTCASSSLCWMEGVMPNAFSATAPENWPQRTLLFRWNGASWSYEPSSSDLWVAGCKGSGACWSAGVTPEPTGLVQTAMAFFDGTSWRLVASPQPGGTSADNVPSSVACATPADCWVTGFSYPPGPDPVQHATLFVIHLAGGHPTAANLLGASPDHQLDLSSSMACASADLCFVVGSTYASGTADYQPVILQGRRSA